MSAYKIVANCPNTCLGVTAVCSRSCVGALRLMVRHTHVQHPVKLWSCMNIFVRKPGHWRFRMQPSDVRKQLRKGLNKVITLGS
jgi:hypothetical protein